MGYSSVQIIGRTAAVKAFQNTDCVNWSLMQGSQLLFKYEGADKSDGGTQLEALLKMIADSSASEAVYTLRWYERDDLPEVKPGRPVKLPTKKFKIYYTTPFDGSFNFKLFEQEEGGSPRSRGWQEVQSLKEELAEIKRLLAKQNLEDSEYEKEKTSGMAGVFHGLLEMPEVKAAIAGKVIELFHGVSSKIGAAFNPSYVPAKIAGPAPAEPIQLPAEQVNLLNTALVILVKADSQFPEHLHKLALIAQSSPETYNSLIGMLNNMK
jgi:hypothetical protein